MILKALWRDCEIDDTQLDEYLWIEGRIRYFGEYIYLQVLIHLDLVLTYLDVTSVIHHFKIFGKEAVKGRINEAFWHFNHDRILHSQNRLQSLEKVVSSYLKDHDVTFLLHVPDPPAGLELRVDHHGVLHCLFYKNSIVDR